MAEPTTGRGQRGHTFNNSDAMTVEPPEPHELFWPKCECICGPAGPAVRRDEDDHGRIEYVCVRCGRPAR
jgi:hypothetical protein